MISILPSEELKIKAAGGRVASGLLQSDPKTKKCPFKTPQDLCGIHFTEYKPFGCIASPFTLNKSDTLIVRNRYKMLKCYKDGARLPAYKAFRASLDLIFGAAEAERVCGHLERGGGDIYAEMPDANRDKLLHNDRTKTMAKDFGKTFNMGLNASPENGWSKNDNQGSGTSIFDPVLCELAYRWFCPPGGVVVDPFAGGSVRGIVASHCGRKYIGVELRQEQVAANRKQEGIAVDPAPEWRRGDSRYIDRLMAEVKADFAFSCPPYANLEVYSDDPADLSTLDYPAFREAYREIIAKTCNLLKNDRFACFVVGDVRDKNGNYYNFVGDTIEAFRAAGLSYYNEAILVTAVGSLPIRVGKQFAASRKLGKTHQNVLVFVKGDGKKAAAACGECDFGDISEPTDANEADQ
jgi:DNA modification methylase